MGALPSFFFSFFLFSFLPSIFPFASLALWLLDLSALLAFCDGIVR